MSGSRSERSGLSEDHAVWVDRVDDEWAWLSERPCACGRPWKLRSQTQLARPQMSPRYVVDALGVGCDDGHTARFYFRVDTASTRK